MGLVLCPECGEKISDRALTCIHCGYVGDDSSIPISQQQKYEIIPEFTYDIIDSDADEYVVISKEDNKRIFDYFGRWENIKTILPGIADVIQAMANSEPVLVASMDDYVKKMIADGVYHFSIDKKGEILPTIRDSKAIVKQVRLKEMSFAPQLSQSLNNLSMQVTMSQILEEIEYVGDAIKMIHMELQDDRLALADSAMDKLNQAKSIQDTSLRNQTILLAISSATDAKHTLMRNFERSRDGVLKYSGKSTLRMAIQNRGQKDVSTKAQDAFQDIMSIVQAVEVECIGYSMLGEYEAGKNCLDMFRSFVIDNKLNKRDTLLVLNENVDGELNSLVSKLSMVTKRIEAYDSEYLLSCDTPYKISMEG